MNLSDALNVRSCYYIRSKWRHCINSLKGIYTSLCVVYDHRMVYQVRFHPSKNHIYNIPILQIGSENWVDRKIDVSPPISHHNLPITWGAFNGFTPLKKTPFSDPSGSDFCSLVIGHPRRLFATLFGATDQWQSGRMMNNVGKTYGKNNNI